VSRDSTCRLALGTKCFALAASCSALRTSDEVFGTQFSVREWTVNEFGMNGRLSLGPDI
jgi:hypothetical protein